MTNRQIMKAPILALILLILTATLSSAALYVNVVTDEFSIESPYPVRTVKECECGTRTEVIEIKNLGDFETLFTAQVFSPIQEYISLSRDTFTLAPGEATKIHAYINAPCDIPMNSFYIVTVSTNYDRSKEIYKEFTSQPCQNIKATTKMLNKTVNPGETACTEIEIENSGGFEETYTIIPGTAPEITFISKNNVTIAPGKKDYIYYCTSYPLDKYGEAYHEFTITSQKAKNSQGFSEKYEIKKDYDYAIKTEEYDLDVCEDVTTKSILTFQNLAKTQNEYYLSLKGPSFVNLSQETLSLDKLESDIVLLNINPRQLDVGSYEATLSATTKFGNMLKEKQFKINVKDCFDLRASINGASHIEEKACCGEKEYSINIVNKGLNEEAYQLIVDSEGWLKIAPENEFVRLKPSEQVNIPVQATLPCTDAKKTSYIIVRQTRSPHQEVELKVNLESLSQRSCYNIEMLEQNYNIDYETKTIPLLLQNTGLKGGLYRLSLTEPENKMLSLIDENVTFNPGEVRVINIKPDNTTAFEEGRYLGKLTLTIKPVDENIDYQRQFWVVLKDKSFLSKALAYLKGLNYGVLGFCGIMTLILVSVLIIFIIIAWYFKKMAKVRRIKASEVKRIRAFNIVLVAILLAGLLFLVFLGAPDETRFYEEPTYSTDPLFHEWKQNTEYRIDLLKYFTDPDMDTLTFIASQPNHIDVKISGSMATLMPEHGWSGKEYVVFTATDSKGESTNSEVMTLRVIKKKPMSVLEYWSLYCKQINIILIMATLLVILMISDVLEEKGYRHYLPKKY